LLGAFVLIATGVGSWRTIVSVFAGGFATAFAFYFFSDGSAGAPSFFHLPPIEHLLMGGFAFGAVFMATDPVSSPFHNTSRVIYGFLIGAFCVII
jgi:Na+-transporting NADH:ubiquinone oxidoreductase subunit B